MRAGTERTRDPTRNRRLHWDRVFWLRECTETDEITCQHDQNSCPGNKVYGEVSTLSQKRLLCGNTESGKCPSPTKKTQLNKQKSRIVRLEREYRKEEGTSIDPSSILHHKWYPGTTRSEPQISRDVL